MELSKERIEEFKEIYKKEYGKDLSDQEAYEAAHNLAGFAELLFDLWVKDQERKKQLEQSPKGFHLDGVGYTCFVCGDSVSNEETWYDKYGIKCMICQKAIDRKEIPPSVAKNKDSWYSRYDLESNFNLKTLTLRRWIKEGIIKARTVTNDGKGTHVQIFLIKDNKDFLPPKKLVESHSVKETKDGKDWYRIEPWYRFVYPHEHLKGFKIMNYLRVTSGEEVGKEPIK
jgi:hypothetical protein